VYRVALHTRLDGPGERIEVSPKEFDLAGVTVAPEDFALSSADKASERQLLSVYEESLTSAKQAAELLGKPSPRLVLRLGVEAMRNVGPQESELDVVWDRRADCYQENGTLNGRLGTGAAGHCGIHGLAKQHYTHRSSPPSEKIIRRSLRQRLAKLASQRVAQHFVRVSR
jgi:hypothetical protein